MVICLVVWCWSLNPSSMQAFLHNDDTIAATETAPPYKQRRSDFDRAAGDFLLVQVVPSPPFFRQNPLTKGVRSTRSGGLLFSIRKMCRIDHCQYATSCGLPRASRSLCPIVRKPRSRAISLGPPPVHPQSCDKNATQGATEHRGRK